MLGTNRQPTDIGQSWVVCPSIHYRCTDSNVHTELRRARWLTNPAKMTVHSNAPLSHALGLVQLQCLNAVSSNWHAVPASAEGCFNNADGSGHEKYSLKTSLAISLIFDISKQLKQSKQVLHWLTKQQIMDELALFTFINNFLTHAFAVICKKNFQLSSVNLLKCLAVTRWKINTNDPAACVKLALVITWFST